MKRINRAVILAIATAMLAVPSAASAATAPGYEEFADCPDRALNPAIVACSVTRITGGHLQMGTKDTPISDEIVLITGVDASTHPVNPSLDGGRQRIPGGLIGITGLDWLRFIYPFNLLQIYAEPELAGPVTIAPGSTAIGLPLKVQLHNALLNHNCYIGADNDPINLQLTPDTTSPPPPNQPITGNQGTLFPDPALPGVIRNNTLTYVDNAFRAPAARNCDLLSLNLLVTALVNAQSGLPSPAGTNETVQHARLALASIAAIFPPAGIEQ